MSLSLANISATTTGVGGLLMAIPQIGQALGLTPANTVGYQPQNQVGHPYNPPSLIFHYEGEQTAVLESDITDHYVENNSAIQDQISLRPETITTHGFIGELTNAPPNSVLAALQVAANSLTLVNGFVPQLTATAQEAYNQASFAYATAANGVSAGLSAFSSITGGSGETVIGNGGISVSSPNPFGVSTQGKQQVYFQQFYSYWSSRTLFTVQTPWAVFQNMAIKTIRAIQDADTNTITDFEVTFKMMRFASVGGTTEIAGSQTIVANPLTRLAQQTAAKISNTGSNLSNVVSQPLPPNGIPR